LRLQNARVQEAVLFQSLAGRVTDLPFEAEAVKFAWPRGPSRLRLSCHSYRGFPVCQWIPDDDPICLATLCDTMNSSMLHANSKRPLSELNQISDPALRRTLLADMRCLIAEANRLAAETAQPKREDKADNRKRGRKQNARTLLKFHSRKPGW
jgi:hypothetical protein